LRQERTPTSDDTMSPPPTSALSVYLELTKARLALLVVLTAAAGFLVAAPASWRWGTLVATLLGTALAAGGSIALNQCCEVERDARMERTRHRPLPSGLLTRRHALAVGLGLSLAGVGLLAALVNFLTAALALAVVLLYVLVYTPLKPRTSFATLVGAVCGAIPPVMGWAAATGGIELAALILAAVLFLWQIPHFLALAWVYRDDYARGGFKMLPAFDPRGRVTSRMTVLYSAGLVPVAFAAAPAGLAGRVYGVGALLLGLGLAWFGLQFARQRSDLAARRVFFATLAYLPLLLALLAVDHTPRTDAATGTLAELAAPVAARARP
jgi:heme o synthase